jgi:hypothetical protein
MECKDRKRNDAKDHYSVQASEEAFIHEQPEKIGWFRKLLDWISKGAAESKMDTTDCPT